jgi:hypothetical protein
MRQLINFRDPSIDMKTEGRGLVRQAGLGLGARRRYFPRYSQWFVRMTPAMYGRDQEEMFKLGMALPP